MNELIDKLDKFVTNLEKLFPNLQDQRIETAAADAAAVTQSANTEGYSKALDVPKVAAMKVNGEFNIAAATTSNVYRNIEMSDRATVDNANYYSEDWAKAGGAIGKGGGHTYDGIRISREAKVQNDFVSPSI